MSSPPKKRSEEKIIYFFLFGNSFKFQDKKRDNKTTHTKMHPAERKTNKQ